MAVVIQGRPISRSQANAVWYIDLVELMSIFTIIATRRTKPDRVDLLMIVHLLTPRVFPLSLRPPFVDLSYLLEHSVLDFLGVLHGQ